mgnify:CR=1 FL=1
MSRATQDLIYAAVPNAVITERDDTVTIEVDTPADATLVGLIMAQN